jgi:hypothetical protein
MPAAPVHQVAHRIATALVSRKRPLPVDDAPPAAVNFIGAPPSVFFSRDAVVAAPAAAAPPGTAPPAAGTPLPAGTLQRRAELLHARHAAQTRAWRFAAGGGPPPPPAAPPPQAGAAAAAAVAWDASCWEGPAGGEFRWFARQREAFEFVDRAQARCAFPPPPLKVFASETRAGGGRRFLVAHPRAFWAHYVALPPAARHFYEVLREDTPVHAYFDLEFARGDGGGAAAADGGALVGALLFHAAEELRERHGLRLLPEHVVHLESSTPAKFSRHVVLRAPCGARFRDGAHAGAFAAAVVRRAAGAGAPPPRVTAALNALLEGGECDWGALTEGEWAALEGAPPPPGVPLPPPAAASIVDCGVYTRNRCMRLYLSCKLGKSAALLPAGCNLHMVARGGGGGGGGGGHFDGSAAAWAAYARGGGAAAAAPSGDAPPVVQVAAAPWEAAFFRASLITDLLPPLWTSRLCAEGRGGACAGEHASGGGDESGGGADDASGGGGRSGAFDPAAVTLSERAAAGGASRYAPATHPTHGFRLLYALDNLKEDNLKEGALNGEGGGGGGAAVAAAAPPPPHARARSGAGPPPFPALAAWALQQHAALAGLPPAAAAPGGALCVRAWAAAHERVAFQLPHGGGGSIVEHDSITAGGGGSIVEHDSITAGGGGSIVEHNIITALQLTVGGSRFCARVGRQHKSNNVYWNLRLRQGAAVAAQACFDAECRGFASPQVRIPEALLPQQAPEGRVVRL